MADNYKIQFQNAQKFFLTYDQETLIRKFRLKADEDYLYMTMYGSPYRLNRHNGSLEKFKENWVDANTFGEVMTLLDILCVSREDRFLTGKWMSTQMFGKYFHSGLLEPTFDELADAFDKNPGALANACKALGGHPIKGGDEAWAVEVMTDWRSASSSGTPMTSFPPRSVSSGTKMPSCTSNTRPCTIRWGICGNY